MALSAAGQAAMAYWGTIQKGVSTRADTATLWAAIRADAAAHPGGAPLPSFAGVNEVRSAAAAIRNSGESLARALAVERRTGLPQSIESRMMTTAPWSRTDAEIATLARYQVRFEAKFTALDGSQFTQWLTATYPADAMPATAGELAAALAAKADADYGMPGATLADTGVMQVTVV